VSERPTPRSGRGPITAGEEPILQSGTVARIEEPAPALFKGRWWLLAVLFFTAIISYSDRLILSVLVDPLRADLGLTDATVGLLQGPAFTLVYVFAALPLGRFADRTKRKLLLFCGSLLWCAATVLCGLAQNGATLLMGRILLGIGEATLIPAGISLVADAFPSERRGLAIGVFLLGSVIGGPFGITLGGVLLSIAKAGTFAALPLIGGLAPWRVVLVSVGCAGLLAPILLLTLTEPQRGPTDQKNLRATLGHFAADRRRLLPLYGGLALLSIGDYGLVSWVPTVLSRDFYWSPDRVGVAFGIVTASAGIAGALLGGWIADAAARRGGTAGRLAISIVGAAVAVAAAAAVAGGSAYLVLCGLGLWIFAATVAEVSVVAVVQELIPPQLRGTGMAFLTFTNTLVGLGGGPTLIAATTQFVYQTPTAVDASITTVGVLAAVGASIVFIVSRRILRSSSAAVRLGVIT
jgi:MFS family permease